MFGRPGSTRLPACSARALRDLIHETHSDSHIPGAHRHVYEVFSSVFVCGIDEEYVFAAPLQPGWYVLLERRNATRYTAEHLRPGDYNQSDAISPHYA